MDKLVPKTVAAVDVLRRDGRMSSQDWRVIDDELRKVLMQKAGGRLRPMNTRRHMNGSLFTPHPN